MINFFCEMLFICDVTKELSEKHNPHSEIFKYTHDRKNNIGFFLLNHPFKSVTRDTATGDPARLPAQLAGRWGLIK
jgi:hypothetical protein